MILTIKLSQSQYSMRMDGNSMTVEETHMGTDKDGNPKEMTSILGYYGPAQVDLAINRIIAAELTSEPEKVNLREFLIRYKAIHETIAGQVTELKEAIQQNRLQTT